MTKLNDFNISQLKFNSIPSEEELHYIMHGNIYQFNSEFYISSILKSKDMQYYTTILPLKSLTAFPLGIVFANKYVTSTNIIQNVHKIQFDIDIKQLDFCKIGDIDILTNKLSVIPDQISKYTNQQNNIKNQYVSILKDNVSGKTIYFPHYEIARWYYLRSSSLCRQALCGNIGGLYDEAKYIGESNKKAEIKLKHGSNNNDASEIFRFAKDEYANIMFSQFSLDISKNKRENKDKSFNYFPIFANFPIYGRINMQVRAFYLDSDSIFIYQIIKEDSQYPFDELNVYRDEKSRKEQVAKCVKNRPNNAIINHQISNATPNSRYRDMLINIDTAMQEIRVGLENKKITFKPLMSSDDAEKENLQEYTQRVSGFDMELSLSDAAHSGNEHIIGAHISVDAQDNQDELQFVDRVNNLDEFRKIIFKLDKINYDSAEPADLSLNIFMHANMPRKPANDHSRAKWAKAFLPNNNPRQYMIAEICIDYRYFYVIELEHDCNDEKISTPLIHKNFERLQEHMFYDILKSYVQTSGNWKFGDGIEKHFMYHVGSVTERAERLFKKLTSCEF